MSSSEKLEVKQSKDIKEKKRRRNTKTESSLSSPDSKKLRATGNSDVKLGAFYREENEVLQRDGQADARMQQAACNELKSVMKSIKEKKLSGDRSKLAEIEAERIHGTLQFVTLKKLNRLAHFSCQKMRESTETAKQEIDQQHLQLQNLLYEVMHLQREITKCLEFKSKDEEINLVSLEEFYREAPLSISKPEITKHDQHQCTLARLDWELKERKSLAAKFKEAKKKKDQILSKIKTNEEYLDSLQPKLNAILQTTKPVQEMLAMPFDEQLEQHSAATYLPRALYVLYMQAVAYRDAFVNSLAVTISGDKDSAVALEVTPLQIEEDSDSDQEEQENATRRGGRKADSVMMQKRQMLLKKHPLSVIIKIACEEESELQLTFTYMLSLDIVTVTVNLVTTPSTPTSISAGDLLSPTTLLDCLYDGDFGTDIPNGANMFILQKVGISSLSECIADMGWPYTWLQRLCGSQVLSGCRRRDVSADAQAGSLMQDVIRRLKRRVHARLCLQKQLASLEQCIVPVINEYQGLFPAKTSARLTAWRTIPYSDFIEIPYTANLVAAGLVEETSLLFTAIVDRQSARMTIQVVVSADYPVSPPVFAVCIALKTERTNLNDENVRDIEAEVNLHYMELVKKKSRDQLLTNQLQRLMMCFDIYLETEQGDNALEGPTEFARENIFPRLNRGPNRGHAYKYSSQLGFFCHR